MVCIVFAHIKSLSPESSLSDITVTVPNIARLYCTATDTCSSKVKVARATVATTATEQFSAISEVMVLLACFNWAPLDGAAYPAYRRKPKFGTTGAIRHCNTMRIFFP